jgi:hypothetical protein
MVGITIGAVFAASALVPHTVTQTASGFQSQFVDVPAFNVASAALTAGFAPSASTSCTAATTPNSPTAISTSAVTDYYSGTSSKGQCNPGNFSEIFNITTVLGSASTAGTWNFTFSINSSSANSSVSPFGPVYTIYTFSTYYSTSSSTAAKLDLTIYLEFGAFIPANGIFYVNLLVTKA